MDAESSRRHLGVDPGFERPARPQPAARAAANYFKPDFFNGIGHFSTFGRCSPGNSPAAAGVGASSATVPNTHPGPWSRIKLVAGRRLDLSHFRKGLANLTARTQHDVYRRPYVVLRIPIIPVYDKYASVSTTALRDFADRIFVQREQHPARFTNEGTDGQSGNSDRHERTRPVARIR
jgi:hypothetical protein